MNTPNILKWASADGSFKRQVSQFRNWISKEGPYKPESSRYVLYVSLACPWAHRTLMVRELKGLQDCIRLSVVDYLMGENGWKFSDPHETSGCIPDPLYKCNFIKELYLKADPNYSGRFTVPVLFDSKLETIVNNESAEIVRMLNSEFNDFAKNPQLDLYPEALRPQIDEMNAWIYDDFNNGVYKAGFATTQEKYAENVVKVRDSLLKLDSILSKTPFLCGSVMTEADIRCFTTALRHDPVYYGHFKCNLASVKDCENVLRWMKRLYPLVKTTINMDHIKCHYYMSHKQINPNGIVPLYNGPALE